MGRSSLELADVNKKVVYARLESATYFVLQRLMAEESQRQNKKITMQVMIGLLITRAAKDIPSLKPSEMVTEEVDAQQTTSSAKDKQPRGT